MNLGEEGEGETEEEKLKSHGLGFPESNLFLLSHCERERESNTILVDWNLGVIVVVLEAARVC